jgi:hypothetical protein
MKDKMCNNILVKRTNERSCMRLPLTHCVVADPGVALLVPHVLPLHVVEPGVRPAREQ